MQYLEMPKSFWFVICCLTPAINTVYVIVASLCLIVLLIDRINTKELVSKIFFIKNK